LPGAPARILGGVPNKFPDEYRETLERLVKQMAEEAPFQALQTLPDYAAMLARVREPDFGLCERCGAVLSLARLVKDMRVTLCQACDRAK
jgi:RNA polymerase-binding transcription factor DksA